MVGKRVCALAAFFFFLAGFPSSVFSLEDIKDVDKFCRTAVIEFFYGNYEKSMDLLQQDTVIPDSEFNELKISTVRQMSMIKDRFGTAKNMLLVDAENIKDRFYKTVYVIFYENHIIRLEFIFFKPEQQWKLDNFVWDDNIDAVFN